MSFNTEKNSDTEPTAINTPCDSTYQLNAVASDLQLNLSNSTPTEIVVVNIPERPWNNQLEEKNASDPDIIDTDVIESLPLDSKKSKSVYDSENISLNQVPNQESQTSNVPPPDKGYAWAILIAGLLNFILSFGSFNAFGVFQTYYLLDIFKDESAESISWISTLTVVMTLTGGLFSGRISRILGIRNACLAATVLGTVSLILSSFFKKIWHLVITQGIMYGFASSILINLSLTMQILWFEKHKGLSLSIVSAGGGIGSLILVPTVTATVNRYGIRWSFRILAAIYLVSAGIGSLLMRPRVPFKMTKKILDFKLIKDPFLLFLAFAGFTMNWGYCVPLLYFPASLESTGKSISFSTNFIMVFSAASIVGRISSGFLSDKVSSLKILLVCQSVSTIAFYVLWYKRTKFGFLVGFYIVYGIFGLNFFSLGPNIIGRIFPNKKVSLANAMLYLVNGVSSLIGIPVLGKIFQTVGHRTNFDAVIIIGGGMYALSLLSFVGLKIYISRNSSRFDHVNI
ncbi:hypothetical protein BB560_001623 [Smittium megazygosporum]|uniref:Major facilitator superfamily (MFS) profile domain-containing protein n=1 Tax=Smittium megazygosporum TaxID=133381 RepID=A0A2T9ZH12_9FUNG|nr:hypothetical protein BB560_001623 [Smittium megazygosporum]